VDTKMSVSWVGNTIYRQEHTSRTQMDCRQKGISTTTGLSTAN